MKSVHYYLPGTALILMAVLILAVPQILVAMVASMIILTGIGALIFGHKLRKSQIVFRDSGEWFSDKDCYGRRYVKRPVFRDGQRWF